MLLLFTLGASAQPAFYGQNGPYLGAGTPAAIYPPSARQVAPQQVQVQVEPSQAQWQGTQAGPWQGTSQSQWDLQEANRVVNTQQLDVTANNLFYNTPLGVLFPTADPAVQANTGLLQYAGYTRADENQKIANRIQDDIDYYRSTHPQLTDDDRNHLDDLKLQLDSARNQKIRRTFQALPTAGPYASVFERRAREDDLNLAQNALHDARSEVRQAPSQDKVVSLRNAQDDVEQAQDRRDATTFDLVTAATSNAGQVGIAPILRKKASQAKLNVGYRNLRVAQDNYDKDPSESNRMKLRLARLFIDATTQEDDANTNEALFSTNFNKFGLMNVILQSKNFQDESNLWLQYDRLHRKILLNDQAADAQSKVTDSNTVAQRMLGLSLYGPSRSNQ